MSRALAFPVAIGLLAVAVAACGVLPAAVPADSAPPPDPPRFTTLEAALTSDLDEAAADLGNETADITNGDDSQAAQHCYILSNNVRYDVERKLDQGASASASGDAASLQARLDATWHELVNLQQYSQEFSNNGVAPFNGDWAAEAITEMMAAMTATAGRANTTIATINGDVAEGYRQYRAAWQQWGCPVSKLIQGSPPQVPKVTVKKLPKPRDP